MTSKNMCYCCGRVFVPSHVEIENIFSYCQSVVSNEILNWEYRYDLVFAHAPRVRELLPSFEYYDPDYDYEADVRAFVTALESYAHAG